TVLVVPPRVRAHLAASASMAARVFRGEPVPAAGPVSGGQPVRPTCIRPGGCVRGTARRSSRCGSAGPHLSHVVRCTRLGHTYPSSSTPTLDLWSLLSHVRVF